MIRITGGEFRGRLLSVPPAGRTRPTQAKLRQALFNSVQMRIPESRCVDLFAGSGSLGFEALSRGATHVVFVENDRNVAKILLKNAETLRVTDRMELWSEPVEKLAERLAEAGPFDVVFADPPYAGGWELRLLQELDWSRILAPGGILVLEWGTQKSQVKELPETSGFLAKVREKSYGESILSTFERID